MSADRIATAFSSAARHYDFHARLQKGVAVTLADWLPETVAGFGMDLGCGTGPTAHLLQQKAPAAHWLGVDMAEGMLSELVARGRSSERYQPLQATATSLPFADDSLSCIYSSFSLQWVADKQPLVQALHRVLAVQGEVLLAVPLAGSLQEMADSYRQAGLNSPVNNLATAADWETCFLASGFCLQQQAQQKFVEYHPDFSSIHRMIKGTGAHVRLNGAVTAADKKLGKSEYRRLQHSYDALRQSEGLPVSWQVAFWRWQK